MIVFDTKKNMFDMSTIDEDLWILSSISDVPKKEIFFMKRRIAVAPLLVALSMKRKKRIQQWSGTLISNKNKKLSKSINELKRK